MEVGLEFESELDAGAAQSSASMSRIWVWMVVKWDIVVLNVEFWMLD